MSGIFSTTFEKSRFDQVLKETFNANKNNGSILLIKINFHGCPIFLHHWFALQWDDIREGRILVLLASKGVRPFFLHYLKKNSLIFQQLKKNYFKKAHF
jgi:hypothetical protein